MNTPRENLRAEYEATRIAFHELLDSIPDQALDFKGLGNAWSIKAELWHITQSLDFLAPALIMAHRGRVYGTFYLHFPAGIQSWLNGYILVPLLTRHITRQEIAQRYERAHQRLMDGLERTRADGRDPGAELLASRRANADLFHRPAEHFQLHAERIRHNLELYQQKL